MATEITQNMKRILAGRQFRGATVSPVVPVGERGFIRYTNPVGSGKRLAFLETECSPDLASFIYMGVTETLSIMTAAPGGSIARSDNALLDTGVCVLEYHSEPSGTLTPYLPAANFHSINTAVDQNVQKLMHNSPQIIIPGQGIVMYCDLDTARLTANALWYEL